MRSISLNKPLVLLTGLCFFCGCAVRNPIPPEALQFTPQTLQFRQMQTRRFDTSNEKSLLIAATGLLQDLGFNIDETETKLGVIVGSKDRDATEVGQQAAAIFLAILTCAGVGVCQVMPTDKRQKIRASLITRPLNELKTSHVVRVTFQRIVWNTQDQISKIEPLNDPKAYQEFFEKLSKAMFLEAHAVY